MLDLTTNKGKIIDAALQLAAERNWSDVTLRDIALRAGITMSELKRDVSSKAHILALFTSAVDRAVLDKAGAIDAAQSARDNLFEAIMNRFDAMQPYRDGIKSILAATAPDPRLAARLLSSQGWMLEAAGISCYGPVGGIKTVGLASVYLQVVRIWLEDDDPGMARTMAALDRRLRRGERSIQALDDGCRAVGRLVSLIRCTRRRADRASSDTVAADGGPVDGPVDVTPEPSATGEAGDTRPAAP